MEDMRQDPIEKEQDVPKGYVSLEQLAPFLERLEEIDKLLNELVDLTYSEAKQIKRYLDKVNKTATRASARSVGLADSIRKLYQQSPDGI